MSECGATSARNDSEHGPPCDAGAYRQATYDEQRATFARLSPSTFGFAPYDDDDPYD